MSDQEAKKPNPLRVVSSLTPAAYPHHISTPLEDPHDPTERARTVNALHSAARLAHIEDYKVIDARSDVTIYLKGVTDVENYTLATLPDMAIEQVYLAFPGTHTKAQVQAIAETLQAETDGAGFAGQLTFAAEADLNAISFLAGNKKVYFDFLHFQKQQKFGKRFAPDRTLREIDESESTDDIVKRLTIFATQEEETAPAPAPEPPSRALIGGGANPAPTPRGTMRLVDSFHYADYIYSFTNAFDDPHDAGERALVMRGFRGTVENALIRDYKLIEGQSEATLYLRTPEDLNRFRIAREASDMIEQEFVQFEEDYDFRKIKRANRRLQMLADAGGFGNSIMFAPIRSQRSIMVFASPKKSFFEFAEYVEANRDKFRRYLDEQRETPEFNLEEPAADTAVVPNIRYSGEEEAEKPANKKPPSERFIRGGATDETVTAPSGAPSLATAYRDSVHNFKLNMSIGYNPDMNAGDRIFRHDPTYPDFKLEHALPRRVAQIQEAMRLAEVHDYFLWIDENKRIQGRFDKPQDLAVAVAAVSPDSAYKADFVYCSPNSSPMKLKTRAKRLRAIFAEAEKDLDIRFEADMERCVISVCTNNSQDFIRVQGAARRLEKSHAQFQHIVGLT